MKTLKRVFKRNTHNIVFSGLAGFGRSMNRFYENRNHDVYSNGEARLLKRISKINPKTILDVGANIGGYSLIAHKFLKNATIYSFEPVLNTFNLLKNNTEHISDKTINLINKGLYKENIKKQINLYPAHTHSSLFDIKGINNSVKETVEIDLISGDNFMRDNNIEYIDFLKLDVEGAEMDVLNGVENALKNKTIRLIQFEYGYINITTKNLLVDYYDFFAKYDYIIGKIYPKKVKFRDYSFYHEDFIGPNFVAIHKSDNELKNLLSK